MLWPGLKLPTLAHDVTFRVDFGGCEAEFAIDESIFLVWCSSNKWNVNKISSPISYCGVDLIAI